MHALTSSIATLIASICANPGASDSDVYLGAELLQSCAKNETSLALSHNFLTLAFSGTVEHTVPVARLTIAIAEELASDLPQIDEAASSMLEAQRIMLTALATEQDLFKAALRAIDAIEIGPCTSQHTHRTHHDEPQILVTPLGYAMLDRLVEWMSDEDPEDQVSFRIGFVPFEGAASGSGLEGSRYKSGKEAKDALKALFTNALTGA